MAKTKKDPSKKKKTSVRYKNYEVSGTTLKRKNRSCPKCGAGILLAEHKDRQVCGKCGYSEIKSS